MSHQAKVVGSAFVAGLKETHEILKTDTAFKTACGFKLNVLNEDDLQFFLRSNRGPINISCPTCAKHLQRVNKKAVLALLRQKNKENTGV